MKSSRRKRDKEYDEIVWMFLVFFGLLIVVGLGWTIGKFITDIVGELTRVM